MPAFSLAALTVLELVPPALIDVAAALNETLARLDATGITVADLEVVAPMRQANAGVPVDALHFNRSNSAIVELGAVPLHRLHYWQLCDGPAERPATTKAMIHTARHKRMFPGEGVIDLVSVARALPADIMVRIEVPTAELVKTMCAKDRAQRALDAARKVIARSRDGT